MAFISEIYSTSSNPNEREQTEQLLRDFNLLDIESTIDHLVNMTLENRQRVVQLVIDIHERIPENRRGEANYSLMIMGISNENTLRNMEELSRLLPS